MRQYKLPGGKHHPSVTTILGHGKKEAYPLRNWKAKNYNWRDILAYKADRGTLVHIQSANRMEALGARTNAVQEIISIERMQKVCKDYGVSLTELFNDVAMGMMFFDMFMEENKIVPLRSETVVWSNKYGFAGQVDQVMFINGELTIVDIKTAKKVYKDKNGNSNYGKQLSAYAIALAERTGNVKFLTCKRAVLLLSPDVEETNRMTYELVYFKDEWDNFHKILKSFQKLKLDMSEAQIRDFSDIKDK